MIPLPSEMFESVTLTRYVAGVYTAGRWVEGAGSSVTITGCVQPATSEDLKKLNEGDRTTESIVIWSPDEIRTVDEVANTRADRVLYNGQYWLVQRVERFGITPQMSHYSAICLREQKA